MFGKGANNPIKAEKAFVITHGQGGLITRWVADNVIPSVGHGK